ncbi:hypothetical protein [Phormidium sp. CCY1219]|jgi:hypothetical protein|uniref:hypothetical protein n=1 Tax=Phormidium sp. CCY1219 TaxID=2886104 RepID=UPI002D1F10A5|nr:hypothetical protein [Phormidium sp. CCY1219]MEB3829328.1 hypothetical protein [Phormidium sp. CCY1219]
MPNFSSESQQANVFATEKDGSLKPSQPYDRCPSTEEEIRMGEKLGVLFGLLTRSGDRLF